MQSDTNMGFEQREIYEFMQSQPGKYFSVVEISYRLGVRHKMAHDRLWAAPHLHRLHMEGFLETNETGDFRVKQAPTNTTCFYEAIEMPGASLEDTTIIRIQDVT